ncbi:MAG: hypothetical protein M1358_02100 [Chloroflexi bacterium]|nr:hypothetical protein [Chloroflexota bacterium]
MELIPPSALLSLIIASSYAFALQFLWGRRLLEIPLYLVVSTTGFFVGTALAGYLHSGWPTLGSVSIIEGSLGAWALLLVAYRLAS